MVDAATGGNSVLGVGIESSLGVRGGSLYATRFNSVEFSRNDKENPATEITGAGGRGRGTPGEVDYGAKLNLDGTVFRLALLLASAYGAPAVSALKHVASVTVGGSGSGYTDGSVVTFSGGDATTQATGHVVTSGGNVTSLVVDTPGSGYTSVPTVTVADGTGNTFTAVLGSTPDAWLLKFRPGTRTIQNRSLWVYLDEGGSYPAQVQNGRRASEISVKEDANKRLVIDASFAQATGDTISGFPIAKASNSGDFSNGSAKLAKVQTRGRRPEVLSDGITADPNWSAKKSLYLKVTARDPNTITFKAAFATASGATDGSGFATPTYGSTTFVVRRPGSALAKSGYVPVVLGDGTRVGLFLQGNSEKYEITFGDQDLSTVAVNDEFEIPAELTPGVTSTVGTSENKLSAYHLLRIIGGSEGVPFNSGTMKLTRPFDPYYVNGRKSPDSIDPVGDIGAELQFTKRVFDRAFRSRKEQALRLLVEDIANFDVPVIGGVYEGWHFLFPQTTVTGLKSGEIKGKDAEEEQVTLEAEQPDADTDNTLLAGAPPSNPVLCAGDTFDDLATYPFQVNLVCRVDPSAIAAT